MKAAILLGAMVCALVPAAVQAAPYIGFDANRYSITLKSTDSELFPQSAGGEDIHVGERFGNFAGELGYGTSKLQGSGNVDNLHLTRATLDGFIYFPIYEGLNFLVTAGGADTNYGVSTYSRNYYQVGAETKSTNADVPVTGGNEFDWRGGAGFSFGLDEFEFRVLGRYQPLSMGGNSSNALSIEVGLNFYL